MNSNTTSSQSRNPLINQVILVVAILGVATLGVFAYFDLRSENIALREQLERSQTATQGEANTNEPTKAESSNEPTEVWRCHGVISPEMARAVAGRHGPDVFNCYEQAWQDDHTLRGHLLLEIKVSGLGIVQSARVTGLQNPNLLDCIQAAIFDWSFPPARGGDCAVVSMPFMLDHDAVRPSE